MASAQHYSFEKDSHCQKEAVKLTPITIYFQYKYQVGYILHSHYQYRIGKFTTIQQLLYNKTLWNQRSVNFDDGKVKSKEIKLDTAQRRRWNQADL